MNYQHSFKRLIDIILSLFLLGLVSPLFCMIPIGIRLSSPGSIFFLQKRLGKNKQGFQIIKFRTMSDKSNRKEKQTFNNDPDLFFLGKILRRFKLDELPQLINVLRGEMSFIGPRPMLYSNKDEIPEWACARFNTRPGITGLAQINGNIFLTWEQRWKYDVQYTSNISFLGDIKIIIQTALVVIFGEDKFKSLP